MSTYLYGQTVDRQAAQRARVPPGVRPLPLLRPHRDGGGGPFRNCREKRLLLPGVAGAEGVHPPPPKIPPPDRVPRGGGASGPPARSGTGTGARREPPEAGGPVGEELLLDPFLAGEGEIFSLRVKGDSMEGAHICEGDYVLVRAQETAEDGEIVVAVVEGAPRLKRIRRQREGLRLDPANPAYAPLEVQNGARSFRIAGKVVGIFRKL